MPTISAEQAREIQTWVRWFKELFVNGDYRTISDVVLRASELPELENIFDQIVHLSKQLDKHSDQDAVEIEDASIPFLKRVLITIRRNETKKIEVYREEARHPDVLNMLERKLEPLEKLLHQGWLETVEPMRMPRLTDYLSIQQVEKIPWGPALPPDRVYDEKFGILQAPKQFFLDLSYFRRKCALRGRGVIVAYLDIDNFKKFNQHYLETKVDHLVLPRFMETIEAHVYMHGDAYRYGGDEYVLMLPNMDHELGNVFLDQLRRRVAEVRYPETEMKTTISVGYIHVDPDSHLTDREAVKIANVAKNYAKKKGKNRLATYHGPKFTEDELYIVSKKQFNRKYSDVIE